MLFMFAYISGYLSIMEPILSSVIWCMSLTGCLGVSVSLAVASDMASMLTFHIYCFYVYAARFDNILHHLLSSFEYNS